MHKFKYAVCFFLICIHNAFSQTDPLTLDQQDSVFIKQYQEILYPHKVYHAEPLYIDLIRDLGARKGEKEWNFGAGITDNLNFDSYNFLAEYEFAPINRLGIEFEIPFTIYSKSSLVSLDSLPKNRIDGLQFAAQWTFFVSESLATSIAIGYLNKFGTNSNYEETYFSKNNRFINNYLANPFLIAAKRWGNHFHSLLHVGFSQSNSLLKKKSTHQLYMNSSIHYMIPGTRNFIGMEINNEYSELRPMKTTLRPQMRLGIAPNFMIGIVAGIPMKKNNERMSSFIRLIWEPMRKPNLHTNGHSLM